MGMVLQACNRQTDRLTDKQTSHNVPIPPTPSMAGVIIKKGDDQHLQWSTRGLPKLSLYRADIITLPGVATSITHAYNARLSTNVRPGMINDPGPLLHQIPNDHNR